MRRSRVWKGLRRRCRLRCRGAWPEPRLRLGWRCCSPTRSTGCIIAMCMLCSTFRKRGPAMSAL
eukprot:4972614-Lingulodinium_polyedra.AAC.1